MNSLKFADRFKVLEELGFNSVAIFYRCLDSANNNRRVLVKKFFPEIEASQIAIDKIRRSVLRFENPIHIGITRVLEFYNSNIDTYYITEDFVGQDLCSLCEKQVSIDVGLSILRQLASALDQLHKAGIIHRDIKPETVFMASDGSVRVSESLISIDVADTTAFGSADGDIILAEVDYVAPEYLQNAELSTSSDIWALGVLGFELLVGQSPFCGETVFKTMTKRLASEVDSPCKFRSDCPTILGEIITKALSREPLARFSSAELMAQALEELSGSF